MAVQASTDHILPVLRSFSVLDVTPCSVVPHLVAVLFESGLVLQVGPAG